VFLLMAALAVAVAQPVRTSTLRFLFFLAKMND